MSKCNICGKQTFMVVEVCHECLQKAAVDPEQIKKLKQISNILSITADKDRNIKACMESLIEITEELERGGTSGKEEKETQGNTI